MLLGRLAHRLELLCSTGRLTLQKGVNASVGIASKPKTREHGSPDQLRSQRLLLGKHCGMFFTYAFVLAGPWFHKAGQQLVQTVNS